MKIVIILGAFLPIPPIRGGAVEKRWYQLAKEFSTLGHKVVMISREYGELSKVEVDECIEHRRVRGYDTVSSGLKLKVLDFFYARRACRAVPSDADVIITNTFWAPVLINKGIRNKVYVDVARMPKGQMRLYQGTGRLRANSSPVADAIRKEIPTHLHHLVKKIPNPLPFNVDDSFSTPVKDGIMLYVGRIHPEKGIHLLLAAMKIMKSPPLLRIVGPWSTEEGGSDNYIKQLRELAYGLPVEFAGPIYDLEMLNAEYARASVFIYPSLAERGETFGLAPLEAMAWGCIPVVSDLLCFKDFIQHGTNGLVFNHRSNNPTNSLAQCIEIAVIASAQNQSMARNAMQVRQSHSPRRIAMRFLEDLLEVSIQADRASK